MNFTSPWFLLLLLALLLLPAIAWPRRSPLRRGRDALSLLLRAAILNLIVLALAGAERVQHSDRLTTIFLLDASDSVGGPAAETGLSYIRRALAEMAPDDQAGVILFGADASVERSVSDSPRLGEPASLVNGSYTNIAKAVRLGLTLFPQDTTRRLVIISDGGANVDDARQAVQLAQANGVEVSVAPLPAQHGGEVRLDDLRAPATLHQGERFDLTVKIHSTAPMSAPLQIFSEGQLVVEQALALQAGDNSFVLPLVAGSPGFTNFSAQLQPPTDTFAQNNSLDALSEVRGPLQVLIVAQQPDEAQPLGQALADAGLQIEESTPAALPSDLAGLSEYAAVVLVNVPAPKLSIRQMENLHSYVRDLGGGLVTIGGEESYGPGGYFQTRLEEMLPIEMRITDPNRKPQLTLLPIIDKSGSMADGGTPNSGGPRKVELAKEAVYRSLDLLVPLLDRFGLVAFDNAAQWVVEPTQVLDVDALKDAAGAIRADGGTDILAGLQLGAKAIVAEPSPVRHIVLLTDGGADPGGIPELTQELADQGVTVSVVAIGFGYPEFLEEVAEIGGGRFHFADDATVIPQIFAQETALAGRSYLVEETFTPQIVNPSPILQGFNELPPLHGYVATARKLTAQVVLAGGEENDPLLAQWQYGLGRSVAWTSDAKGQWAEAWVNWPEFPRFWAQVVRWTIVESSGGALESQIRLAEDRAIVTAEVRNPDGSYANNLDVALSLVNPKLAQQTLALEQVAPGLYEGQFQPDEVGTYLLNLTGRAGNEPVAAQTRGFVVAYSPEYRETQIDPTLMPDLASLGGGQVLPLESPGEAFAHTLPPARSSSPLWPLLILLATCLLPLDVAVRRVVFGREDVRQAWAKLRGRLPSRPVQPLPEVSSAGQLLKVKQKSPDGPPETPQTAAAGKAGPEPPRRLAPATTPPESYSEPAQAGGSPAPKEVSTIERLKRVKQRRRSS